MSTTNMTLTNDFHGTSAQVRTAVLWHGIEFSTRLSPAQWARLRRKLCGLPKGQCTCGVVSGPQAFRGKKLIVDNFPY
jgi:hypothetical protein